MSVTWKHVDGFYLVTRDFEIKDFITIYLSLLNKGVAADYDEKFPLGMVPVLALGDAGLGDIHGELPVGLSRHKLCEATPGVLIHFERKGCLFIWKI